MAYTGVPDDAPTTLDKQDRPSSMRPLDIEQEETTSVITVDEWDHSLHEKLKTIAGISGNVLEWYDFAVFGFFGDVIGDVFFPPQEGNAAIIESFAVFGGAFLMRPGESVG